MFKQHNGLTKSGRMGSGVDRFKYRTNTAYGEISGIAQSQSTSTFLTLVSVKQQDTFKV